MNAILVDNAKVMSKGQVTIPKDIRAKLGLSEGDRVTFIWDGSQAVIMNAAAYALKALAKDMDGAAEKAGLSTDDDITALCKDVRKELAGERSGL